LPEVKILAGVWGFSGDLDKALERFGTARPDAVVATLAQAVAQIGEWRSRASDLAAMSEPMQQRRD